MAAASLNCLSALSSLGTFAKLTTLGVGALRCLNYLSAFSSLGTVADIFVNLAQASESQLPFGFKLTWNYWVRLRGANADTIQSQLPFGLKFTWNRGEAVKSKRNAFMEVSIAFRP